MNKETQEIIITSYFGDREPVWGIEAPKKIALATPSYPIESRVEKIPGYGLFKAVKKIKKINSTVVLVGQHLS